MTAPITRAGSPPHAAPSCIEVVSTVTSPDQPAPLVRPSSPSWSAPSVRMTSAHVPMTGTQSDVSVAAAPGGSSRSGFTTLPLALLLEQSTVVHCCRG
jgi:hypothetical protein